MRYDKTNVMPGCMIYNHSTMEMVKNVVWIDTDTNEYCISLPEFDETTGNWREIVENCTNFTLFGAIPSLIFIDSDPNMVRNSTEKTIHDPV